MITLMPFPSSAQSNDLTNRIDRLENEIQTLNRAFYRGEVPANPSPFAVPSVANPQSQAQTEIRLQQMEEELRLLTGRIEQQGYDIQQLRGQIDALNAAQATMAQTAAQRPQAYNPPAQPAPYQAAPAAGNPGNILFNEAQPDLVQQPVQPPVQQPQSAFQPASIPTGDAAALYEQSFALLKAGDYDASEKSFQSFLQTYPDHNLAPNATYWLGETFYVRNRYEEAAKLFAQSYAQYPNSSKSADNLLKLGLSLGGMGKKGDACVALTQLKSEYPNGPVNVLRRADQELSNLGCP